MRVSLPSSLTGHFLIAMPSLADTPFSRGVALLCQHDEDGAVGLLINQLSEYRLGDILAQMKLDCADLELADAPVLIGGPVQQERGFVLHREHGHWESSYRINDLWSITVGWSLVGLGCLLVWALMRSPWGRVLKSIREDEDAVRSLGKNVFAYKMQALVLGGIFGGIAGVFHILKQASAVPTDFNTTFTFYAYAALLVGGAARVLGPVIGSIIFWFLIAGLGSLFDQATSGTNPVLPDWLMTNTQASLIRFIVLGLGLMLLMIYRPQGIFGDRREIAIDGR